MVCSECNHVERCSECKRGDESDALTRRENRIRTIADRRYWRRSVGRGDQKK